jgi:hypothetical protein
LKENSPPAPGSSIGPDTVSKLSSQAGVAVIVNLESFSICAWTVLSREFLHRLEMYTLIRMNFSFCTLPVVSQSLQSWFVHTQILGQSVPVATQPFSNFLSGSETAKAKPPVVSDSQFEPPMSSLLRGISGPSTASLVLGSGLHVVTACAMH